MGILQRAVGVLVLGAALSGAALVWMSAASTTMALTGAALFALWAAATVALLEWRIANRDRRSEDERLPLAPRHVMAATRGVFAGEVTLTVLIPAHDEEQGLAATLESLSMQSRPPERVVVVADNCTDRTADIARAAGFEVLETVGNRHKKAGALNQALARVLPEQGENDLVMVMDADTTLDAGFLQGVVRRMTDDRALMAIGGLFHGEPGSGLIGQFQRNEFIRHSRDLRRRRGRVFVLTGTATVFRPRALRAISGARGRSLPGVPGDVYDTLVLTEDNEITLALKTLGGLVVSPADCTVVTEVMPTWRALWAQRLRWQRGALENLGAYGPRAQTFRYWAQQLGIGYGVIALLAYLSLMLLLPVSQEPWSWLPFWLGTGVVFAIERVVTAWEGGWRARLLAATVLPELLYALFLDLVFLKGILDLTLGRQAAWTHVPHTPDGIKVGA